MDPSKDTSAAGGYMYGTPTKPGDGRAEFKVNKDNVLQARAAIRAALDVHGEKLSEAVRSFGMEPCGKDVVSTEVALAWNWALVEAPDSDGKKIIGYLRMLNELVANLDKTAKSYGYTDADIARGFPKGRD
ncbi:hypothetical protein JOF53_003987 [Crossiella equi]|uniref:Uncharacterized protein n=1 Tax=Crossiella equi TaxID=130796 RepID=A0ABS5AEU6_9PSEU|nr:hypothetical protein [Crossiella equi]MBP2475115.1 hypothetical protein [Crossiella equi]